MKDVFRDQVVIVTGASAGIGKSLALQLAGQGAKVAVAARRAERLELLTEECHQRGGKALVIPTDASDEAQCKALVEKTVTAFGRLDMLINNAGLAVIAQLEDYSNLDLFKHTLRSSIKKAKIRAGMRKKQIAWIGGITWTRKQIDKKSLKHFPKRSGFV